MHVLKLVILDRDGVINEDSDNYIKSAEEWIALPGSLEAITQLNRAGIRVTVATNQSGIGRGLFTEDALQTMHEKFQRELADVGGYIDAIVYCPHHPNDGCDCRKPQPGLYLKLLEQLEIEPHEAVVIGDSLRDLQAADAAGINGVLVRTGNGEQSLAVHPELNTPVYDTLSAYVDDVIQSGLVER